MVAVSNGTGTGNEQAVERTLLLAGNDSINIRNNNSNNSNVLSKETRKRDSFHGDSIDDKMNNSLGDTSTRSDAGFLSSTATPNSLINFFLSSERIESLHSE